MELRHLSTFRVLATTRSFTKTALLLDYVQSNVSAHIQALEKELGVRLFDRLGKKVALTEAGRCLLPYVEQIEQLVAEAQIRVSDQQEPHGQVRIGAPESVCSYRLAPLLQEMHQRHAHVRPVFCPGAVETLLPRLRDGTLDVAFALDQPRHDDDLQILPLKDEPILVLAGPEHPFAQRQTIAAPDVTGMTLLATEKGCAYRAAFEQTLADAGSQVGDLLEFSSVEAIKQCVMAGMGFTILPQMAVRRELAARQLVAIAWNGPPLQMQLQLVWHRQKWLAPAIQALIATAQAHPW